MANLKDMCGRNAPLEFDITDEFNELKETFSCKACNKLLVNPIVLNTCGHIQCKSCLDNRKLACAICKCPYSEIDIAESIFTQSVTQSIKNIESILNFSEISNENKQERTFSDGTKFEIVIAKVSMKRNLKGETPLHMACKVGNIAKAEELIQSGVDINATDWANWAPIHEAVHKKRYNCIELLLKNNSLVNIPGAGYQTPLHKSIFHNADEITEILLRHGADLNAIDITGCTPMSYITDDEKLNKFKNIVPVNCVQKLFFSEKIVVFAPTYDLKTVSFLTRQGIKFISLQEYTQKDDATHLIVPNDQLSLNLLYGILKGIFIVNEKWIEEYPKSTYSFKYIIKSYNDAINRSIENKLQHKPKLFDGIKFHVMDHDKRIKIHGLSLMKENLNNLIESGGGKTLHRPPALRTVESETIFPYHAPENLRECSHYIIFNEQKEPELIYNMKELKHRSSKWLIDCILNFKILD